MYIDNRHNEVFLKYNISNKLFEMHAHTIFYKMAVLTRKAHTTGVPSYLKEHLVQLVASRPTRSSDLLLYHY